MENIIKAVLENNPLDLKAALKEEMVIKLQEAIAEKWEDSLQEISKGTKKEPERVLATFNQSPHVKIKVMKHGRDPVVKKPRHSIFIHNELDGTKKVLWNSVDPAAPSEVFKHHLQKDHGHTFARAGGVKWHDD